MTIKELVEFTDKSERTLRRWIEKSNILGCDKMSYQVERDYSIDEVEIILKSGSMSKDAVTILMQNARQSTALASYSNHVDYEAIGKMISIAVSSAMQPLINEIRNNKPIENKQLQIEQVPEKTSRAIFKQHIDQLVKISNSDWSTIYNAVYSEMGYVYNVKIKARANNRGIKPIDVLEQDNLLGKAIAVTRQMIERLEVKTS